MNRNLNKIGEGGKVIPENHGGRAGVNFSEIANYLPGAAGAYRMLKRKKASAGGMALVAYSGYHIYRVAKHRAKLEENPNYLAPVPGNCREDLMKCYSESELFQNTVNSMIVAPVGCGAVALFDGFRKKDLWLQIGGGLLLAKGLMGAMELAREK